VQHKGAAAATSDAEWRCFVLGAGCMAAIILAALGLVFALLLRWHAASPGHHADSTYDFGDAMFASARAVGKPGRSLPVSTLWRDETTCPWHSASRWLESLQQDDDVWSRLRDRCVSSFQGLSLDACADLPRGLDCSRAVEHAFWRFALAHVPGSGNRGRYAEQVVVPKLTQALGASTPRIVLVPDDCDTSTLFSRSELKHLLEQHASFCDLAADVLLRRAASVVRADPCRGARFEHLVLPEVVREDDEHSTLYLPSLLFAPSLFPDPAVDMARAYAAGPVLLASALASACHHADPDLTAVNVTLQILRRHAPKSAGTWEADFVRRASAFLDCRDSELRQQSPAPDRALRLARALLREDTHDTNNNRTLSDSAM
jgi:hypothetical protein